jgi:cellulose synthase/poly-beta-1,6-N-acetylglucosamine synthase-like glycosyltransferase
MDRRTLQALGGVYMFCFVVTFTSYVDAQLHFEVPREKLDSTTNEYGVILLSPGVVFLVVIIAMLGVVMVYNIFITLRVMCQST